MKKVLAVTMAVCLTALGLAACSSDKGDEGSSSTGSVYFYNFKPEVAQVWEKIAADYEKETGVKVKVATAAAGEYESSLKAEITKRDAPTIFQINGPVGYADWADYTADIKDSDLAKALADPTLAITDGDGVYGVPYVVEGYGIIYNDAIMQKYFALPGKAVSISSAAEITNFATLKQVADDIQANKDALGIKGAFSVTSLKPGEDWRWQTHLADVPFYYEFEQDQVALKDGTPKEIKFSFNENFKNLFDLYLTDSTTAQGELGSKTVDDAMAEFAMGQTAMVQNGNWAWNSIKELDGNVVKAEDIKFLPLYTGVSGEESQGLCIGTENYFSINSEASEANQKASLDFLYWLFSSDTGKKYVTTELGFIAPFNTFSAAESPDDPLAREVSSWMNKDGVKSVPWVFTVFPSQQWKDDFGGALLTYAQGSESWDKVVESVVADWAAQAPAAE